MLATSAQPGGSESVSKKPKLFRYVAIVAVAALIFMTGWMVGGGRLHIRSYDPVRANKGLPDNLDLSSVETVYKSLRQNFDGELSEEVLLDGIKSGLARATNDPYTEYFNPSAAEEFTNEIEGVFEGIGAQLGKDADNNVIIISPLEGYPAERAGLRPKDIIAQINGESAYDLTISEAVDKIRGEKGTSVKLTIIRSGEAQEVEVTREEINVPSVKSEIKNEIGILKISRFSDDTVRLAQAAAVSYKSAKVKGIVLDLRGNPGGYLEGSVDVAELWLERKATILTERRDNVVINTITANGNPLLKGIPTVVLIDEGSASASEILAGALKDNEVATLLGQKSFGKGSVQQPINLRDGGLLKVTIARWFTPNGKNIDKEGIEPDEVVELTSDDIATDRDPQLDTAISHLNR